METTVAKIVYSPCPPSSKDVIWGKTVNGKIEFQTFGNEGWKTVAKEDILKDIFQIKDCKKATPSSTEPFHFVQAFINGISFFCGLSMPLLSVFFSTAILPFFS